MSYRGYSGIFTVSKEPLKLVEIMHEGELLTGVWVDVVPVWPSRASRRFHPVTIPTGTKECWVQQGKRQYRSDLIDSLKKKFSTWLEGML